MMNLLFENLNCLIIRDFWMVKIWPYFHKSIRVIIFFLFQIFCPKSIFFERFTWVSIHMDFVGFPFRTSKLKNDINYIKYKYSHRFGKVCRSLNMYHSKIIIIIFFKVTTMSIWIILKNLVWTYKECKFVDIEPFDHAFTLLINFLHKRKMDLTYEGIDLTIFLILKTMNGLGTSNYMCRQALTCALNSSSEITISS
jgi:hypothetical protein